MVPAPNLTGTPRRGVGLLVVLAGASVLVSAADAVLYSQDLVGAENLLVVWSLAFGLLTAMWIEADSRGNPKVYRTYEFGFLLYLIWPVYLPYYLVRTRGAAGLVWLAGFALSLLLSWPVRHAIWLGA